METIQDVVWEARVRKSDVPNMTDEEIKVLQRELNASLIKILWEYGIHNQRRIIRQRGQGMSEPMYLMGDEYALKGTEDDIDEDDDSGLPDRMWEDDV